MSCAVHAAAQKEIAVALHGGDLADQHWRPAPARLEQDQLPEPEALAPACRLKQGVSNGFRCRKFEPATFCPCSRFLDDAKSTGWMRRKPQRSANTNSYASPHTGNV